MDGKSNRPCSVDEDPACGTIVEEEGSRGHSVPESERDKARIGPGKNEDPVAQPGVAPPPD
jgi:hypothetical protein